MTSERDVQRSRAAQAGFAMRAYRESFTSEDGRRGLTQEELLRRMAAISDEYAERFSHATVSRWESGATRPTVHRLRTFGSALHLSDTEIAGLIMLAGLAPDFETAGAEAGLSITSAEPADVLASRPGLGEGASLEGGAHTQERASSLLRIVFQILAFRFLLFALFVTGAGYALSALGWDGDWMPVAYIFVTTALVMVQGLAFSDPEAGLRDFFWVSLFFVLAVPSLQFAPLQMDHYGFYARGDFVGTHVPFMLSLLLSLAVAALCSLMFQLLWRWQASRYRSNDNPLIGPTWAVLPPIGVAYLVVLVLSNASVWIQSAVVMSVLASLFTGLLVLRDPAVNPSPSQRRFLLQATFTLAVVAPTLGIAVVMAVYMSPYLPNVLPDHNLLGYWEINFDELGYTREEALERLNLGYLWHATYLFVYMTFVVGGSFIKAVYRLAGGADAGPDAVHSDAFPSEAPTNGDRSRGVRWMLRRWPILSATRGE